MSIRRFIPILAWAPTYKRDNLSGDVQAGLTTAVMLIPQGMAYAMLAGLPPIVGLYASLVPLAIYAMLGTSRELAVGPVAMVSLLVAQGIAPIAEQGSANFIALAVLLALMVGVMQLMMGLLRLGFLVNFLSHPVISGFTSAAALIIGLSQLKHLLGIDMERSSNIFAVMGNAASQTESWHVPTLVIGAASVALLLALKKFKPLFPRALAVVAFGSVAVFALGLSENGVRILGEVPAGLPTLAAPTALDFSGAMAAFSADGFGAAWAHLSAPVAPLLPVAIVIALVGYMESISVAKAFARQARYDVDPNQELVALGAANIAAGFFSGYPVTGGFSRTAVNVQSGSKTGLASLITAGVIGLTLLWFTPLFHYLPKAVLAAIIMTAVFGLIDVQELKHLWKVKRSDLTLLVITFVATLGLGIEEGILVGVGASLALFIFRSTRPHSAVLGRIPGTETFRNVDRYPNAQIIPGVLIVRVDAQLYFGNVTFLKERLAALETPDLRALILDASGMNQLDSSAESALEEIYEAYQERGIQLIITGAKGPVRDVMHQSGLWQRLGDEGLAVSVHEAAQRCENSAPVADAA